MTNTRKETYCLVLDALMIALFVVLSRLLSLEVLGVKITVAALPIVFTAFYLGMKHTVIVAAIGEFISQLIGYGLSPTTVLWMIPVIVRGIVLCFFIALYLRKNGGSIKAIKYSEYFVMILISAIIVFLLNTAVIIFDGWLYQYLSVPAALSQLLPRFISMCASVVIYTLITKAVVDALPQIRK